MIVKILMDNRLHHEKLKKEHGLSLYIETKRHKCLVDVGQTDAFMHNAKKMGVDIADIDYLFITHGHSDHVGGLPFFLEKNSKAQVIISGKALSQQYFSKRKGLKDISPNINVQKHLHRFRFIPFNTLIENDIKVITEIKQLHPLPKANEYLFTDSSYSGLQQDDFKHELIICFGEKESLVCTGCGHNGLLNIIDAVKSNVTAPIKWVIGGFHLLDADDMNQYETPQDIEQIAVQLKNDYPQTIFYTGHCTGEAVFNQLKHTMGEQLNPFYVGLDLELN